MIENLRNRINAPVDAAPLAYFRVVFGAVMLWEVYRYFAAGRIDRYYVDPEFTFPYPGFEWLSPWGGVGMHIHFVLLGVLAVSILVGFYYRISAALFSLGFTYVFLLDQANYLNHFYLIALVSAILVVVPAHRTGSIDAWRRDKPCPPKVPAWTLALVQFQLAIPYVFGGIAKLNGDWLRGEPMRSWLTARADFPVIGPFFTEPWAPYFFSYGGIAFDLAIVPMLLWSRTRVIGVVLAVGFHLTNSGLFDIGIFPWFMLASIPVFFGTPWTWPGRRSSTLSQTVPDGCSLGTRGLVVAGLFVLVQVGLPFRHHAYPGPVAWTEEGHKFSWRMKLRDKEGSVVFRATHPALPHQVVIKPSRYLTERQEQKLLTNPAMVAQLARHIEHRLVEEMGLSPEFRISADAWVSLNGRDPRPLIDPAYDLTEASWGLARSPWVLHAVD